MGAQHVWVGNCGDSRAIVARKGGVSVALSSDHKASRKDEVARVQKAGGMVWWDRVMGELAISRAIGDHRLRPYVIPDPEVECFQRSEGDQLLILASDGLWDVLSNADAGNLAVRKFLSDLEAGRSVRSALKHAASSLAKAAISRGSRDNVTVIVVDVRMMT